MNSDINYIIQKSLNGDKNYQEILLQKLNPLLYKHIYKYWNSMDLITEDLVQEGYTVILQALKTFDKERKVHFLHYVKTEIQYFYKNYYKKSQKQRIEISISKNIGQENFELEKITGSNVSILENIIIKENTQELLSNIKKLSTKEQEIIYLYYYKEQSLSEISEKLNIPYRTVMGKKKTAIKKLRLLYQEVR